MVLKSLEIQGFKSFPDRTTLNFGKGITAVVGPNGSGKSNISDAVRWVLGETSSKSLRGSKMEDVIFSGTSARKALGFAQVQLTLDNTDQTLKDKGEVVTVSRRYYRSGESEYKIDGEIVRARDIRELFMDTGLGSDGYSMVGQGKIDSIISQKNEDRRELFEEAAGISLFRHKRKDATRRLDQAQENLVRLLDILGELESRVEPLRKQSEKAQKFITLSDEKKTLEIGVWVNKINRFTNDLREQEHKIDAANASYDVCEKELKEIEQEIEEIAQKTVSINTQIEQIRAGSKAYEEQALRKDGEASVLETTLNHNNETIERLKNDIGDVDSTNLSIDAQIEEKEQFISKSVKEIEEKKAELKSVTDEMNNLLSSNEEFSKLTVELNQKITSLTLKLSDCRVKAKSDENLESLQSRIDENNNSMQGYKIKLENKNANADKIKAELEKVTNEYNQKVQRAKMLLDLEKNMEGFSGAVKAVMRQAQNKALSGIHGPLSQLITVDNEYSVAVEVALGAAMQNIVVGNEADAKRAIYYLKNNRVGRATFLPISAIKPRSLDERDLDDNLGFVAIASDLVDCKNEYKIIISNLLGRVVIVEDMDSAIGISKRYSNRFKIVTVDGQVINPGGSMTGGSQSKGAGILSRGNMIDELNNEAKKLEKQAEEIKAEYKTALEEANFALAALQGAQADLQQAKEELIRAQGEHKLVAEKYDLLSSQLSVLVNEKDSAKQRIAEFENEAKSCEVEIKSIEDEISKTESELEKTSGNASELNAKRDEYREKSEKINLELVTLAKDNEAAKLSVEELNFRKNSQSDRVKTIEDEIKSIEEKNQTLLISINEIKASANDLRVKAEQSDKDVSEQINQRNELEKRTTELRGEEKIKNQDREKLSGSIVRLDERKIAMKKEYDELNDMLFEQYELTKHEAEALDIQIDDMTAAKRRLHEIKVAIKSLGSINAIPSLRSK